MTRTAVALFSVLALASAVSCQRDLDGLDCDADADAGDACAVGYECNVELSVCVPEDGCTTSVQCGRNGVCVSGECLPVGGGEDAGLHDAGEPDAGEPDAGTLDAGYDAGIPPPPIDAGDLDAGYDAGGLDAGGLDAGGLDAGPPDAGYDAGYDAGVPPNCGDGVVQYAEGEQCDNPDAGACDSSCQLAPPDCGDGTVQLTLGEQCDPPNLDIPIACTANCRVAIGLACDDGNTEDWEACEAPTTVACDGQSCVCDTPTDGGPCACNPTCSLRRGAFSVAIGAWFPGVVAALPDSVWFSDSSLGANRLQRYTHVGATTQAVVGNSTGHVNGDGLSARFRDIDDLAFDGTDLYVADANTIRKVTVTAPYTVTTVVGQPYSPGSIDNYPNCPELTQITTCFQTGAAASALFQNPRGLAWAHGKLYITDADAAVLVEWDPATTAVTLVAGEANERATTNGVGLDARFEEPRAIAWDGGDMLYIVDVDAFVIRSVHLGTRQVATLVGTPGISAHLDGPLSSAQLHRPRRITSDGRNLYFTENLRYTVRQIDLVAGEVSLLAGTPGTSNSVNAVGTQAQFESPWGIAWDPWRNQLYVAEAASGGQIRRIE